MRNHSFVPDVVQRYFTPAVSKAAAVCSTTLALLAAAAGGASAAGLPVSTIATRISAGAQATAGTAGTGAPQSTATRLGIDSGIVINSATDGGGKLLQNTEIQAMFWGSSWTAATPPTPSAGQLVGAMHDMLNGPYLTMLNQYGKNGRISRGRLVPIIDYNNATSPGPTFTDATITSQIISRIKAGALPAPTANADTLYTVFLPTGVSSSQNPRDGGKHGSATYNGTTFYWAWITNDGTMTSINSSPKFFSHEMVEAITDPDGNTGGVTVTYTDSAGKQNVAEIGDVCNTLAQTVNGHAQQAYYSIALGGCVNPTAWSGVYEYSQSANTWTRIGDNFHQLYAGGWGLVGVDATNFNVWKYNGTPNSWTQIGGPGSLFAVSDSTVYGLAPDASGVWKYSGSGTSWTNVGGAALTIYAGGTTLLAATPSGDRINKYSGSGTSWTTIGAAGNQFVVNRVGTFAVTPDHAMVVHYNGSGTSWTQIGGAANQIFAGAGLLGAIDPSTKNVLVWTGSNPSGSTWPWYPQGAPGDMFAITGATSAPASSILDGLTPDLAAVNQSLNTVQANPTWKNIGGFAEYLVGGGTTLRAISTLVY